MGNQLERLINFHLQIYPDMCLQDVYKLLHQGIFGPQHLLLNPESARSYLQREWEGVKPTDIEALTEPVSIDGEMIRVNLRPYKAGGGKRETLWQTLYNSAIIIQPDNEKFARLWQQVIDLCQELKLPFSVEEVERLGQETTAQRYPALHHSTEYQQANKPAYRVVLLTEWEKRTSQI